MSLRVIPRSAVDGAVKLARLPLDVAVSLLPANGDGSRPAVRIALDRWEATLRQLAGSVLRDDELRADAVRRRAAADERARALALRNTAERRRSEADEHLADRVEEAEEQRAEAQSRAERQREQAARRRAERTAAAARTETKRKAANRKAHSQVAETIEEKADEARLAQLEAEANALEERERTLTARSEAQRLQDEATARKAARKKG
jgi:flagellar biosynthesis GTPase FlhF